MGSLRAAVLLVPSAVAGSLSYWQVQRMRSKVRRRVWRALVRCSLSPLPPHTHVPRSHHVPPPQKTPPKPRPPAPPQEAAVAQAREAMAALPLDLTRSGALSEALAGADHRHRRVRAEGSYLHGRSVFVGPRPLSVHPSEPAAQRRLRGVLSAPGSALKRGYLLVTPLELGPGEEEEGEGRRRRRGWFGGGGGRRAESSPRFVLVNRGWVPPEWRDLWPLAFPDAEEQEGLAPGNSADDRAAAAAALRDAQPRGRVRVTGAAQPDETPSAFVPRNAARHRREFFSVVASEIAEACGVWPRREGESGEEEGGVGGVGDGGAPPPPLVQVCYDDAPGGGGVLDPEGRGEHPTTRALPAELEAAARAAGGSAVAVGALAAERERRIAAAAGAARGASVFPLPKPASGLARFSTMPEDHAGYAAMWGLMSAGMAALALRRPRRIKGGGV